MTTGVRGRGLGFLLAVALAASLGGLASPARADVAAQGCSSRAVVVVEPGPGPVSICFDGSISGLDALQLAGANPVTYGFAGQGGAVCQLFGVGNPADSSCLIGPGGQYWAYYRAGPGAGGWTYSRAGASSTTVTDGSVEGWRYGTGDAPGFVSFCAVVGCAPPATDPPATQPPASPSAAPATAAPAPGSPAASSPAPGTAKDPGAVGSTTNAETKSSTDADGKDATTAKEGTTTTGKSGTRTSDRRRSDTVEVAAGADGGGSSGGSPVGVIVALAVVAVGVVGGVLLRRRRRGPTPG